MKPPNVSKNNESLFRLHSTAFRVIKAVRNPLDTSLAHISTSNQTIISECALTIARYFYDFIVSPANFEAKNIILIKALQAQSV